MEDFCLFVLVVLSLEAEEEEEEEEEEGFEVATVVWRVSLEVGYAASPS